MGPEREQPAEKEERKVLPFERPAPVPKPPPKPPGLTVSVRVTRSDGENIG